MGRPKALLEFAGTTLIGRLIDTLKQAGVDSIRVVVRPDDDALHEWLSGRRVKTVENPSPEDGMLSSILCGIADLAPSPGGDLLVCPADLPTLQPATIRSLRRAFEEKATDLAVPAFEGRRGHPLLIRHGLFEELRTLDLKRGLHQVLARNHTLLEWPVEDPGVLRDIDTPAEYEALRQSLEP